MMLNGRLAHAANWTNAANWTSFALVISSRRVDCSSTPPPRSVKIGDYARASTAATGADSRARWMAVRRPLSRPFHGRTRLGAICLARDKIAAFQAGGVEARGAAKVS